ncbi:MAG: hypothetical protein HC796_04850, partial [Synechococcaceae cyanobacterium RL_1_2]|nr:hypothetical protein [Synechococcaceae cyanobacterium RL_1_2]
MRSRFLLGNHHRMGDRVTGGLDSYDGLGARRLQIQSYSSHGSISLTLWTGITLWCSLETLWSHTPLWWPTLAYSQSPSNLWILQWGQLSGPNTINGLLLLVNGLIAIALTRPQVRPPQLILAAIIIFSGAHGIGGLWSWRLLGDNPTQQVNVGLIQGNIPTKIKSSGTGLNLAINRYVSGYKNLASQGADLIVTPETALTYRWSTLQQERD